MGGEDGGDRLGRGDCTGDLHVSDRPRRHGDHARGLAGIVQGAGQFSDPPGPKFRLTYYLDGGVMSGKFQMEPTGATEFKSYLEWSGTKK